MPHYPPPHHICVHILTHGKCYGVEPVPSFPYVALWSIPCISLQAPPSHLCNRYTGLDRIVSDTFFSYPANEAFYRQNRASLEYGLNNYPSGPREGCVVIAVSCKAGVHRSVAMAERMTRSLRRGGYVVSCEHLDLARSIARRGERLAREGHWGLRYHPPRSFPMRFGGSGGRHVSDQILHDDRIDLWRRRPR